MSVVSIEQGDIRGDFRNGCYQFLGLPYAAPPTGARRWQPPSPPTSWTGTRDATEFGASPIQTVDTGLPVGIKTSEDCLFLNVWTTNLEATAQQPVMCWIFGGGFLNGSSSMPNWHGNGLAGRGVTVVSINYRLGAFGFLAHPEAGCNFAVLDWVAALKWISRNIRAFGGDPNNVTVFGQSSGGAAVRALLSTPSARGLFHRGIIQSAGFEEYASVSTPSLERVAAASQKVFDLLGSRDLEVLRGLPSEAVRAAAFTASGLNPPAGQLHTPANLQWYCVEDGEVITHGFEGWAKDVPVMFGITSDEMRGFYRPKSVYGHPHVVPADVYTHETLATMARVLGGSKAEEIITYYTSSGLTPYDALAHLGTVAIWSEPALATYSRFAALPGRTTYYYRFQRLAPAALRSGLRGYHSAEIPYIFGPMTRRTTWSPWGGPPAAPTAEPIPEDRDFDSVDVSVAEAIQAAWVEFARTGIPRSNGVAWPACAESDPQYTAIGDKVEAKRLEIDPIEAILRELRV
ncbi:alpha/beta-hydrolase [Hyaloscypha variabilis]